MKKMIVICPDCGFELKTVGDCKYRCDVCDKIFDEYKGDVVETTWATKSKKDIPEGCVACGGPYPQCKTSCKIFDD